MQHVPNIRGAEVPAGQVHCISQILLCSQSASKRFILTGSECWARGHSQPHTPVGGPAGNLHKGVGSMLADADGIKGVGDGFVAEFVGGLLRVPLRSQEGVAPGLNAGNVLGSIPASAQAQGSCLSAINCKCNIIQF